MKDKIRLLIADDHTIVRNGVRMLLENEKDVDVIGEALDGEQAVELAEQFQPDVILMDISMPGINGMEATRQIKEKFPEIQILALTMHHSDEYFFAMLKAGASGYLLKTAETDELLNALHTVARGEAFLYPSMIKRLIQDYISTKQNPGDPGLPALSKRETDILHLLAEGFSNKEIAEKLVVSQSTIHTHRSRIMKKLDLHSHYDLIQFARKHGLIRD